MNKMLRKKSVCKDTGHVNTISNTFTIPIVVNVLISLVVANNL